MIALALLIYQLSDKYSRILLLFFLSVSLIAAMLELLILKEKYGQLGSQDKGKNKFGRKMPVYGPHLNVFEDKWSFDYEWVYSNVEQVRVKYQGTLIEENLRNDEREGPLVKFLDG